MLYNKDVKKKLALSQKLKIGIVAWVFVVITAYFVWDIFAGGPLTQLFNNREALISLVESKPVLAPLVYLFLQILQTVVAPIPGGAIGPIGGFLFGWAGVVWTLIGSTIGAYIVFLLSKKFGRKLLEKLFDKNELKKFDMIPEERAGMVIFALFLIPGLPDDTICYLAGLSNVPMKNLLAFWAIGRFPAIVVANYLGMGFSEGNITKILIILGIIALILGFVAIEREKILKFIRAKIKSRE